MTSLPLSKHLTLLLNTGVNNVPIVDPMLMP